MRLYIHENQLRWLPKPASTAPETGSPILYEGAFYERQKSFCLFTFFLHLSGATLSGSALFSFCLHLLDLSSDDKQVAQRATIAHLSPMFQGQISFQKTYKWAMETRGPKSNSSELLCLSWLPATLMTIWSKMNELAFRHHFHIISLWEIF